MQRPGTDIGSLDPWWGKEEQIASANVPLMTGTKVSHNSRIPTFEGNLASCVRAGDNGNMSSALSG